jgi:N-acetylmuramoyl-L-alanine amidase
MTIIDHPSPNHSARRPGVRVDTVVLHHTASVDSWPSVEWLSNPKSGVSAHYVITNGGTVYRLVSESLKAWHAGLGRLPWETCKAYDFNQRSIGIELVNPGDGVTPFTEAQYRALGELLPGIVRRQGWKHTLICTAKSVVASSMPLLDVGYILGHRDVAPGRKTDPADNFDWGRVREMLTGRTA